MFTIYDTNTGMIISRVRNPDQIRGRSYISGSYDPEQYRVVKGQAVALPAKPAGQSQVAYLWDSNQDQWTPDLVRTAAQARGIRDRYLRVVDKMNPVWWSSLSPNRQAEFTAYREALLDVTQQPGWPLVIEWPAAPTWL